MSAAEYLTLIRRGGSHPGPRGTSRPYSDIEMGDYPELLPPRLRNLPLDSDGFYMGN